MSHTRHLLGRALCWGLSHRPCSPARGALCVSLSQVRGMKIQERQSFPKVTSQGVVAGTFRPGLHVKGSRLWSHFGV